MIHVSSIESLIMARVWSSHTTASTGTVRAKGQVAQSIIGCPVRLLDDSSTPATLLFPPFLTI